MPTTPAAPPPPEVDPPEGVNPTPAEPEPATGWRNWAYVGRDRIYSAVPVTVTTGTVLHWHSDPGVGDGCWTATTSTANTKPDNWRPEPTDEQAAKLRGDDTPEEG